MTIHHRVYMHIQFSHGDTEKCPKINFIIMPKDFLLLEKKFYNHLKLLLAAKSMSSCKPLTSETALHHLGLEL